MSNPFTELYLEQKAINIKIQPLTVLFALVLCSRASGLSGLGTALSRRHFSPPPPSSVTGPMSHRSSCPINIGTAPRLSPSEPGNRSLNLLRIRHGVPAYHRPPVSTTRMRQDMEPWRPRRRPTAVHAGVQRPRLHPAARHCTRRAPAPGVAAWRAHTPARRPRLTARVESQRRVCQAWQVI